MVYCTECETDLDIDEDEVDEGAVVSCPECGTDFEVVTVNPVELKIVGEDEVDEMRTKKPTTKRMRTTIPSDPHIPERCFAFSQWPRRRHCWRLCSFR